ncbi:MATE family efflux transporter [Fibrobacter sp. UWB13]|uniref:MATE family efflux transporter n=1 Tax=Fibrobacter sp. UWB13 TaxID=1896204 RepID=UPI000A0B24AB|nr:MATE family efflux transporter [Fibrobacter sp. UWB13]SMG18571.1 Na+-driven multidrug efflux pump [Fibrobacter sp. UWB13]
MFKTFLSRKFFSLLLSSSISILVISVLALSDSVIAGVMLGEDAVMAICLVVPAYSLAGFGACVVALGIPILYNRAMGEFNKEKADRCFAFGLFMAVVMGLILYTVFMLFGDAYLRFYEPSTSVFNAAKDYFFWYKYTILLLPIMTLMDEMVLADGDETLSMVSGIVQIVGNIVCSIVLAKFVGIEGIGFGSFIGTLVALLVAFAHLLRKGNSLKLGFYFSFKWLVDVVKYSAIDAGTYLFLACFTAAMNRFITFAYGPEMLVLGAVILFVKEIQIVFDGVGEAFTPLMNIYLGEESYDAVKKCYNLSLKTAVVEGLALTLLMIFVAPFIVELYDISDPAVYSYAVLGVRIEVFGLVFLSLLYLLSSYYLLIDKIKLGFVMSALRDVLVVTPVCVVLGYFFGIYGMFAGVAIGPALTYVITVLYIRFRYGKDNYPLLLSEKLKGFKHKFYEFKLNPESIVGTQHQVEKFLVENNIEQKTISKAKLLIEDLYMLIYEKNGVDKAVYAECTVIIRETGVQIITKDDGVLFDLSSEDVIAGSIIEFMVSGYMEKLKENKKYLTTMSYNRNTFRIKYEA